MSAPVQLPVCCLFKADNSWREILIVAELNPGHWLLIDEDWMVKETVLPFFDAVQRSEGRILFGDPTSAGRFADVEEAAASTPEGQCHWLRTSEHGEPRPGLHGRNPGQWVEGNLFRARGNVEDSAEAPRGFGMGALQPGMLKRLVAAAQRETKCVVSPRTFLAEALEQWQLLVFRMQRSDVQAVREQLDRDSSSSSKSDDEGLGPEEEEARCKRKAQKAKLKESRANALELKILRRAKNLAFERALAAAWSLLPSQLRNELMSEAARDIGMGLDIRFKDLIRDATDRDMVAEVGLSGFMSRQVANMSACLAEKRNCVSWETAGGCAKILHTFEQQLGLTPRGSATPFPSLVQCRALQAWKGAIARMKRSGGTVVTRAQQPGRFLLLPVWPQRCIAGFAMAAAKSWSGFARLATTCQRGKELCFEAGSWQDCDMSKVNCALGQPQVFAGRAEEKSKKRPFGSIFDFQPVRIGAFQGIHLNQKMVTLLKLGLAAFSPAYPVVLCGDAGFVVHQFAKEFRMQGFAAQPVCKEWAHPPSEAAVAKKSAQEGKRGPKQPMVVPNAAFAVSEQNPSMVIASEPVVPVTVRQPAFCGGCYQVHFVEFGFGFDSSLLSEVFEVFGLAFICSPVQRKEMPVSLFVRTEKDVPSLKLLIVGSGRSRFGLKLEPGAYLARQGDDVEEYEIQRLDWSVSKLARGDRLGVAVVDLSKPHGGYFRSQWLGLVFLHNGRAAGGRWMIPLGKMRVRQPVPRLLLEEPLSRSPGSLSCEATRYGSGPPLKHLLQTLGEPPCPTNSDQEEE